MSYRDVLVERCRSRARPSLADVRAELLVHGSVDATCAAHPAWPAALVARATLPRCACGAEPQVVVRSPLGVAGLCRALAPVRLGGIGRPELVLALPSSPCAPESFLSALVALGVGIEQVEVFEVREP